MTLRSTTALFAFTAVCIWAVVSLGATVPSNTAEQDELVVLAKAAVRAEVTGQAPPAITNRSPAKPVFVTIERKGKVVGCRGGLETRSGSLQEEIVLAARAAAKHDPRYPPLTDKSLQDYQVTVTIVEHLDLIGSAESLRPADGLVLKAGTRIGVVLPWEGKDPVTRLQWAYKKAGVQPGAACQLQRMKAERFRG